MAYLVLICGLSLATAIILESRLSLNTLIERAVMIFSLAAVQMLLSVQVLSLATYLNGQGLILAGLASASLAGCAWKILRPPASRVSWRQLWQNAQSGLLAGKDRRFVVTLFFVAAGMLGLNALAGVFMAPLGDAYHFDRPLFWMQNQSIAPPVAYNPWITATSFAGEALGLPGFVFCKSGTMWLGIVWLAGALSLGVAFSLAGRLGCNPRASMVAAVLLLAIPVWHQYFIEANAAMCLAGLWVGASVLFMMGCEGAVGLTGELLSRLGCSVFCLMLGCGAKNTTIFLTPVFLLALAICLRRLLFQTRVVRTLAGWGLAGILCSGMLWNYACNIKRYGSIGGPTAMQELLVSNDQSISAIWTRCCRGAVLFLSDVSRLPRSSQGRYDALCEKTVGLLGGRKELAEDVGGSAHFAVGSGFGLIGPVVILPAFFYGAVRFLRARNEAGRKDKVPASRNFWLLLLFVTGYASLCHVLLKSQDIGLWRVMPAFPVLAAPVCGLLLEGPWRRSIALMLAGLCALIPIAGNLVMVENRIGANEPATRQESGGVVQRLYAKIGKPPPMEVECQWGNEAPRKALLHEPYNNREIVLLFLQKARHPTVIALAGGFTSRAYYFFGPDLSNRVTSLVDFAKHGQLLEPPSDTGYLVFLPGCGIDTATQSLWAARHDYEQFLRVEAKGEILFASFQKIPNPDSRDPAATKENSSPSGF